LFGAPPRQRSGLDLPAALATPSCSLSFGRGWRARDLRLERALQRELAPGDHRPHPSNGTEGVLLNAGWKRQRGVSGLRIDSQIMHPSSP
jgi:hypothetical protein